MGCGTSSQRLPDVPQDQKPEDKKASNEGGEEDSIPDSDPDAQDLDEGELKGLLVHSDLDAYAEKRAARSVEPKDLDEEEAAAGDLDLEVELAEANTGEFMSIKPWLGAMCKPSNFEKPEDADEEPAESLSLEFVHGYRSRDCINNLYYVDENTIVYMVAAVGIVYDKSTNTQKFFLEHTDDIISLAFHRESGLVATGQVGAKPKICVWNVRDMSCKATLEGIHQRGVSCLAFSNDGKQLVSVGLDNDHTVVVYDPESGSVIAKEKGEVDRILEANYNADGTFVTVGFKHYKYWYFKDGRLKSKKGIFAKTGKRQSQTSVCESQDGRIVTGTIDGSVYVWEKNILKYTIDKVHDGPVYTIQAFGSSFITGDRKGNVLIWEAPEAGKTKSKLDLNEFVISDAEFNSCKSVDMLGSKILVGTLTSQIIEFENGKGTVLLQGHHGDPSASESYGELWGLAIHPKEDKYATCCDDKTIRLWDLNSRKMIACFKVPNMARGISYSPDGKHLAVGFLEGSVGVFDSSSGAQILMDKRRERSVDELKYSPCGKYLAAGSHDSSIDIYDASDNYSYVGDCSKHNSYITHIDWGKDSTFIQSNCGAYELLYHKIPSCEQDPYSNNYKDSEWDSWTCTLGFPVQGIWPKESDGTDVNAVDRSKSEKLLVTGEDSGLVKLFRYPCIGSGLDRRGKLRRRPQSKRYVGHSEHVTKVRFTNGDKNVISLGGADLAIFQWSTSK